MDSFWAHSKNSLGQRQGMEEHLYAVADNASAFARPFGGSELAHFLGLWHDVGKYHADFQEYRARPKRTQAAFAATRITRQRGPKSPRTTSSIR